jgi:hypothetical protein
MWLSIKLGKASGNRRIKIIGQGWKIIKLGIKIHRRQNT